MTVIITNISRIVRANFPMIRLVFRSGFIPVITYTHRHWTIAPIFEGNLGMGGRFVTYWRKSEILLETRQNLLTLDCVRSQMLFAFKHFF